MTTTAYNGPDAIARVCGRIGGYWSFKPHNDEIAALAEATAHWPDLDPLHRAIDALIESNATRPTVAALLTEAQTHRAATRPPAATCERCCGHQTSAAYVGPTPGMRDISGPDQPPMMVPCDGCNPAAYARHFEQQAELTAPPPHQRPDAPRTASDFRRYLREIRTEHKWPTPPADHQAGAVE